MEFQSSNIFGEEKAEREYKIRPAAYAVITSESGKIAVIKARRGYFLPGGGIEKGETPEKAVEREAIEECGNPVQVLNKLGTAIEFLEVEAGAYEIHATFFDAEFTSLDGQDGEHELNWVAPQEAAQHCFYKCQAWAIREYFGLKN